MIKEAAVPGIYFLVPLLFSSVIHSIFEARTSGSLQSSSQNPDSEGIFTTRAQKAPFRGKMNFPVPFHWICRLRGLTAGPLIKAFRVRSQADVLAARESSADHILLDHGAGTGAAFDWSLIRQLDRPYFLAGGLYPENVAEAVRSLRPFAVDVSSGIETDGRKDGHKMQAFVEAVRGA